MKNRRIKISLGRTEKAGKNDYEFVRVDAGFEADIEDDEDYDIEERAAFEIVKQQLKNSIEKLKDEYGKKPNSNSRRRS